jgi:ribose transport system ATP-binding protein
MASSSPCVAADGRVPLELRAVSKRFPGVRALDRVSLTLKTAEILALVGENGAGKSTLLKILGGIIQPNEGEILVDGAPRPLRGVRDALSLGIALIHQELNLAPSLSVAENLFLGRYPNRGPRWLQLTDRMRLNELAREELGRIGLDVSPHERVGRLSLAQRQLIEIARALTTNARILVLDEPTSSLSLQEADRLFAILEELRRRGVSVVYVSHRLHEVERLADRAVVLRDGRRIIELARSEISSQRMATHMVGRHLQPAEKREPGKVNEQARLTVSDLRLTRSSPEISFAVKAGEIVGLAGIVGAGRTELARALFGIATPAAGEIKIDETPVVVATPRQAVDAGLALVPEDRKSLGVMLETSVRSNVSLAVLDRLARYGWYNRRAEAALAERSRHALQIRCPHLGVKTASLSGGNQQKVVLAKWLAARPKVLILDEPTRGVDIAAKQEIYRIVQQLAAEGTAILLISSEMEEVIALADRVLVMHQGRLVGELVGGDISEDKIMRLAVGLETSTAALSRA